VISVIFQTLFFLNFFLFYYFFVIFVFNFPFRPLRFGLEATKPVLLYSQIQRYSQTHSLTLTQIRRQNPPAFLCFLFFLNPLLSGALSLNHDVIVCFGQAKRAEAAGIERLKTEIPVRFEQRACANETKTDTETENETTIAI